MKIAIMTQPLHTNYGGTLQAYALQRILINLGHIPETINYRSKTKEPPKFNVVLSKIKKMLLGGKFHYRFTEKDLVNIGHKHQAFIKKRIRYSCEINSVSNLKEYIENNFFSAVVVGSDQTWRPVYSPRIESFFLDFLSNESPILKISYAASFGTDMWEFSPALTRTCKELLNHFDYVSVREFSSVEFCKEKFNINAEHVLDPTMLLSRDEYLMLCDFDFIKENEGKIFNYILDEHPEKNKIIGKIESLLCKEIFHTYPEKRKKNELKIKDFSKYRYPSIESWISSFSAASFVITDSFHGTVFSIIFNKPFVSIINEERGGARFHSLLKLFGLQDRLICKYEDITPDLVLSSIDFSTVNEKIKILKEKNIIKLNEVLSTDTQLKK